MGVEAQKSLMLLMSHDRSSDCTVTQLNVLNDARKSERVNCHTGTFTVYKLNGLLTFFMLFMFVKLTCQSTLTVVFFVFTSSHPPETRDEMRVVRMLVS